MHNPIALRKTFHLHHEHDCRCGCPVFDHKADLPLDEFDGVEDYLGWLRAGRLGCRNCDCREQHSMDDRDLTCSCGYAVREEALAAA